MYISNADIYTSQTSGDWSTITWSPSRPNATLSNNDTIVIGAGTTVTLNSNLVFNNNNLLLVEGSFTLNGSFVANNNVTVIVTGDLVINGSVDVFNNAGVNITGSADINGDVNLNNGGLLDVDGYLNVEGDFTGGNNNNLVGSGTVIVGGTISGISTDGFTGFINSNNINTPTVVGETITLSEGATINTPNLLINDSDGDAGQVLSLITTPVTAPTKGSLTLSANGNFSYTASGNNTGSDSFVYQVCDNGTPVRCANGTVSITITNVNDAPVAVNDAPPAIAEETSITGYNLLSNDSDVDGDVITINTTPVASVSNGSLTINSNGTFNYTPNANFFGTDSFTYQICDNGTPQLCATATVTITVTNVNDAPTAVADSPPAIAEETSISGYNLLANDSDIDGNLFVINTTPVVNVTNGTLTIISGGTFNYTPNTNFYGTDTFTYQVCDNATPSLCATAVVTITVTNVNDAPVAVADTPPAIAEETSITNYNLLANDSDPEGNTLTINTTPVSGVSHGSLTINANGTFNYTPVANYYGTDAFTYQIYDNGTPSLCASATVTITITNVNDAPTAVSDAPAAILEENSITGFNLLANDFDIDGNSIAINTTPVTNVLHGVLTINGVGTFNYTPDANYYGTDSFTYQICDNGTPSLCASATVTITITNVNDAPVAVADTPPAIAEETSITNYNLLANDSDPEGNTITINTTPVSGVAHGTLTINANGTFNYTPVANYFGTDAFTYQICDNGTPSLCASGSVTITITNINDAPVAVADAPAAIAEGSSITGYNLLANDSDPEGNTITINTTPVSGVAHGTLTINADGTFNYTPLADYFGSDGFTYQISDNGTPSLSATATVTITITNVNDAPVAVADAPAAIAEETSITGYNLLANDSDIEGNTITINTAPVVGVAHGTLTINADGTFNYTPVANYFGSDSFTYQICDNGTPSLCATAVVSITITNVNDAPVALADAPPAINEEISITNYNLLANDSDIEGNTITISTTPVSGVAHGTLTINANGTFNYTPAANYFGTDGFTYQICDNGTPSKCASASVTITINNVNDAPVAVADAPAAILEEASITNFNLIANDSDPEGNTITINTTPTVGVAHGTLTINANGTFNYTPTANYFGTDGFTYQICDNGTPSLCATASVTINITNVNDAPVINADGPIVINEETSITAYNLLANDTDVEGNTITINTTPTVGVAHGTLTINAAGTFNYTPTANYYGSDSFTYQACDNGTPSLCNTAVVNITINNVNDAPVAVADAPSAINEESSITAFNLLANDSDPEGNTITIQTTPVTNVSHGTLTINANGTFDYTPVANYYGTDNFTYRICDNGTPSACATANVTITINNVNDAPVAIDDAPAAIAEDVSIVAYNIITNDTDIEGNAITINTTPIVNVSHGTLTINANGTFNYTPTLNYTGTDSFTYRICDNGTPSLCDDGVVTITITNTNDSPTAVNDAPAAINEESSITGFNLLANDSDIDGNTITINTTPVANVSHGTLIINASGTFNYTPVANYYGTDQFQYQICDNGTPSLCATATVNITINNVNDAPVANADTPPAINEETSITAYNIISNDTDIEGNTLTINTTPITNVSHGTLTINANGTFNYTPVANYFGTDQFQYRICDNGTPSACATGTVTITINNVNDAPIAVNDSPAQINEDTQITGLSLISNDSDIDGDLITIQTTPVVGVAHGSLTINANGTFNYTPVADYYGSDGFTYRICDNGSPGLCATATVAISIANVNDAPVAVNDNPASINEDGSYNNYDIIANDYDIEGNVITISTTPVSNVSHGTLIINSDGSFDYTPTANYFGSDSFQYQICDNGSPSGCSVGTVTFTINSVNDFPTIVGEAVTVNEDASITAYNLLANDSDVDGDLLTINTTPVVNVAHGSLTINAGGTFNYTPTANYNGTDAFDYQVCDNGTPSRCRTATVNITVTSINDAPVIVGESVSVNEDIVLSGTSLLANDSDPDGNALTINTTPITNVTRGTLVINASGTYTYTPALNYFGTDNFTYRVCDNGTPSLCNNATVNITVNAVNDAPSVVGESITINEDVAITAYNLLANDSDVEGNTLTINTTPVVNVAHGTLTINPTGTFNYTPTANYNGSDSFQYQVCDNGSPSRCNTATVNITINSINDAPSIIGESVSVNEDVQLNGTSLLANDSDPDGNTLTINITPVTSSAHGSLVINASGTYTYNPVANFFGTDSFEYEVCDNGTPSLCNTATVSITVNSVNDAPSIVGESITLNEDASIAGTVNLLSNDSDIDANTLTINTTPVTSVAHGSLTILSNGTFNYTPVLNYNGSDSFTYEVCDNGAPTLCNSATVTITVNPVNDMPVITGETATIAEDAVLSGSNLLTNDTDVDGNTLSINTTPVTNVAHGTLVINASGTYTYTPAANYFGSDSFQYSVCDNGTPSLCGTGTVAITVTSVNDAPAIVGETISVNEDASITAYNLLANDSDIDGNSLAINQIPVVSVSQGALTINADGTFNYTPVADYNGSDTFTYQVCDNGTPSICRTGVVAITVVPKNDNPTVVGESITINEDASISAYNLLANDSDIDGNTISISTSPIVGVAHGSLTINADGTFNYTPVLNYSGSDSFQYQVCDNGTPSLCNTATVNITINPVNDSPVITGETVWVNEDISINGYNLLLNDSDPENDLLSISTVPVSNVSFGSLLIYANGTFDYTPLPQFNGNDAFTYRVCDNGTPQLCNTAVVNIIINPVNDAPVLTGETMTLNEDQNVINFNLLANDSDPDGNTLNINTIPVVNVSHGTLVINANGTCNYTPSANYNGSDSFTYQVCDNAGVPLCATAIVNITVNPVNDAPFVAGETLSTNEDVAIVASNLISNDSDPDGDLLQIKTTPIVNVAHGTLVINANGTFNYTPSLNYNGTDSFTYEVCDNNASPLCSQGVVNITINSANDAPVVTGESYTINEDSSIPSTNLLANDSDPDANILSINTIPATSVSHGNLVINADGTFTYSPNPNYYGSDSFTYEVCDNGTPSLCSSASVSITISSVNDAPEANGDGAYSDPGNTIVIDVLNNDSDIESQPLTVTITLNPIHGTASVVGNQIQFIADPVFQGLDTIIYRICDNGTPSLCDTGIVSISTILSDAPPVAKNDVVTVTEDIAKIIKVQSNDSDPNGDPLSTVIYINPAHGTVSVINADSVLYTPDPNYFGADVFTYIVFDTTLVPLSDTATVAITVQNVNDAPVMVDDSYTTNEDEILIGNNILSNDTDIELNTLTLSTSPITSVSHGVLVLNPSGTFSYTPTSNYFGTDYFEYRACDNGTPSKCDIGRVDLTILSINDKPVAQNDAVTISEESSVTNGSLKTNDSDPDGDLITVDITPVTDVMHGTLIINADQTYNYTPTANYAGTDSFEYRICDNGTPSLCDTALVAITITQVNDAPVAADDTFTVDEDLQILTQNIISNDSDVESGTLTVNIVPVTSVNNGTLVLYANGTFDYTPDLNFNGSDSFEYSICDNGSPSLCDIGLVTITVNNINDTPVVGNDVFTTTEDIALTNKQIIGNDYDPDGDILTINTTPVTNVAHGSLTILANGGFNYTPDPNYNGSDSFVYEICDNGTPSICKTGTVSITINSVNDKPVAQDDNITINEEVSITAFNLFTNDTDLDANLLNLTVTPINESLNGSLTLFSNGTFNFIPDVDYFGTNTFEYRVCDNGSPSLCDTALVTITIVNVNDAPVVVDENVSLNEDATISAYDILGNDTDPDGDALSLNTIPVTDVAHGTLTLLADGTFNYTPDLNYNGTDSFTYEVCDNAASSLCTQGTVSLTINSENDVPVVVADTYSINEDVTILNSDLKANDSDPDSGSILTVNTTPVTNVSHGTLTIRSNGTFDYIPVPDYFGSDSFEYQLCDNGVPSLCNSAVVTITIVSVNDAPVVVNESTTIVEDGAITAFDITGNDSDADGDVLSLSLTPVVEVQHGTLTLNADGSFDYIPTANYFGNDNFTYEVCDNASPSACSQGTVNITITSINDAPVANDDAFSTNEDISILNKNIRTNDSDIELNSLTVNTVPVTDVQNGTLVLRANGTFDYTPDLNFFGTDSFNYSICDNGSPSECAVATVSLTIVSVNDAPVVVNENVTVSEDGSINAYQILSNDSDPDLGDVLTLSVVPIIAPQNGTLLINNDGTFNYTPDADFSGSDNFTYQVCDNAGVPLCTNGTVSITVTPVNDSPVATDDAYITDEDVALINNNLLNNDSDVDFNTLSINELPVTDVQHGSLILRTNGTFDYTPDAFFNGTDSFQYTVCDDGIPSLCNTATVTITVNPVNNAPTVVDESFDLNEDQGISFNLLTNDSDIDGDNLSISSTPITAPLHGTLVLNSDGNFTYTPALNYIGADVFSYSVCDDGSPSLCTQGDVFITIISTNDTPVATDDFVTVSEDQIIANRNIIANDTDSDLNSKLSVSESPVVDVQHGTLQLFAAGTFSYSPDVNFYGTDSFVYRVCDNGNPVECATATVTITVTPANDQPIVVNETISINEDDIISAYNILTNDSDVDLTDIISLSLTPVVNVSHGTLVLKADGTFDYTPSLNYSGTDNFTYKVCDNATPASCSDGVVSINIMEVNDAPIANDDVATVNEDEVIVNANVSTNDSDPDKNTLTVNTSPIINVQHGTLVLRVDGSYDYTPAQNFAGTDFFTYEVCDNGSPSLCATAKVTITVVQKNDAPIVIGENVSVDEGEVLSGINLLQNDTDIEMNLLFVSDIPVTDVSNGTLILESNGLFTYIPNPDFSGSDSFEYRVCDNGLPSSCATGIVNITVNQINDAPIFTTDTIQINETTETAVINILNYVNDMDGDVLTVNYIPVTSPQHGVIAIQPDGTANYTHDLLYYGIDSFEFSVCDNGSPQLCVTGTLYLEVINEIIAPIARIDSVSGYEDVVLYGDNLIQNDNDPDLGQISIDTAPITLPQHGSLEVFPDGTFIYRPDPDFVGIDSFAYQVCDDDVIPSCDTAKVILTILETNDLAQQINSKITTNEDKGIYHYDLLTLFNDKEGDQLTVDETLVDSTNNGSLIVFSDGTISYVPDSNFNGVDSLSFILCDHGVTTLCDTFKLYIAVNPVNDNPVVLSEFTEIELYGLESYDICLDFIDIDADSAFVSAYYGHSHATATIIGDSCVTYTAKDLFNGPDSIAIVVSDGKTGADTLWVYFQITEPVKEYVDAVDDYLTVQAYEATLDVAENDSINGIYSVTLVNTKSQSGATLIVKDKKIVYTSDYSFCGDDSFTYVVTTRLLHETDTATVYLTVRPPDSDADGIPDYIEQIPLNDITASHYTVQYSVVTNDTDGDGIPNYLDTDSDNDRIPDSVEATLVSALACSYIFTDSDSDVIPNYLDSDSDGDFIPDSIEAGTSVIPEDYDEDKTPNYLDLDSDEDGKSDAIEGYDDCDEDGLLNFVDKLDPCLADIVIPEVFTPNNDGKNDLFFIVGIEDYPENSLTVFNRWGNKVYERANYTNTWDGTTNTMSVGDNLSEGTYYYVLEIGNGGTTYKGFVYLRR